MYTARLISPTAADRSSLELLIKIHPSLRKYRLNYVGVTITNMLLICDIHGCYMFVTINDLVNLKSKYSTYSSLFVCIIPSTY